MTTDLQEAFAPPAKMNGNTQALVGTMASFREGEAELQSMMAAGESSPPLQSLCNTYVQPLIDKGRVVMPSLQKVMAEIISFGADIEAGTEHFAAVFKLPENVQSLVLKGMIQSWASTRQQQAEAAQAVSRAAGASLIAYRDDLNRTISAFNTIQNQLNEKDQRLNELIKEVRSKQHESTATKIWNIFKAGITFNKRAMENELTNYGNQLGPLLHELHFNQTLCNDLNTMNQTMVGVSSVATSLENNWRELGDTIGGIGPLLSLVTPSLWAETLKVIALQWKTTAGLAAKVKQ